VQKQQPKNEERKKISVPQTCKYNCTPKVEKKPVVEEEPKYGESKPIRVVKPVEKPKPQPCKYNCAPKVIEILPEIVPEQVYVVPEPEPYVPPVIEPTPYVPPVIEPTPEIGYDVPAVNETLPEIVPDVVSEPVYVAPPEPVYVAPPGPAPVVDIPVGY
jgi:hypothetical protein